MRCSVLGATDMNETIVEVLIMIAAFIGCLLFAALSAWKAAYAKRTWSLVKGRYVRMPIWNYMSFVALFSAMPIILLLDGCDIWAITAAALTTLILPCGLFGRRVELRGNELILRNEFWISHTVCIEDIQAVYEVGNLASSQIRFKVKTSRIRLVQPPIRLMGCQSCYCSLTNVTLELSNGTICHG